MTDATYSIGLVVEAPADRKTVTTLVDRCLVEDIDWIDDLDQLEPFRWILAGFVASDERERRALASERQRLGFDPTLHPHELRGEDKRSAKTALANPLSDEQREHRCLTEPSVEHLRQRGEEAGLKAFLDEIKERVVPVISGERTAEKAP